mmetsp:Transcript_73623/g.134581  ORF Transcript_73623/g.134581 Transcript_73623/m.134581 type:complete len:265 (+) Transcript_73623:176-970(+)
MLIGRSRSTAQSVVLLRLSFTVLLLSLAFWWGICDVVCPKLLELPSHKCRHNGGDEDIRDDVEQCWLCGVEEEHDSHCSYKAEDVGHHGGVQVDKRACSLCSNYFGIEFCHEGNEDSRDHNVAKAQHGVLQLATPSKESREHQLDWSFHPLGHTDHDVGTKDRLASEDPKHIIEEEAYKHNHSCLEVGSAHQLDANDAEGHAKDIIDYPMLGVYKSNCHSKATEYTDKLHYGHFLTNVWDSEKGLRALVSDEVDQLVQICSNAK